MYYMNTREMMVAGEQICSNSQTVYIVSS